MGNYLMAESKSEAGTPDKRVKRQVITGGHVVDAVVSGHAACPRNVA
jgi:hypothetical protein